MSLWAAYLRQGNDGLLEHGDVVMADKGIDTQHLHITKQAILNSPSFMAGKEQLLAEGDRQVNLRVDRLIIFGS